MKVHTNAGKVMEWLRTHQPATIVQISASGLLNARATADAVKYGIRHRVFEEVKRPGAGPNDRVSIQLTGAELPAVRKPASGPSFEGLLTAWGIAPVPPQLQCGATLKHQLAFEGEE